MVKINKDFLTFGVKVIECDKCERIEVIHCKDCIQWGTGIAGETEYVKCCNYGNYMVGANGYCVYGERK